MDFQQQQFAYQQQQDAFQNQLTLAKMSETATPEWKQGAD